MDNFNKIIKESAEQFNVPFNESHWNEMDGRLNQIRSAKIKSNIIGGVAAVVVLAIASYFVFPINETEGLDNNNFIADEKTKEVVVDNTLNPKVKSENSINENKINNENIVVEDQELMENNVVVIDKNNGVENNPINHKIENKNTNFNPKTTIIENNNVNAEFIVYNNKVCLGEEVSFESSENSEPVSYTWNFGDGTISHKTNPKHVYKESHVYTVTLTLLNRQTGREYTTIQDDIVTIMANPKSKFSYEEASIKHDDNKLKYPFTTFSLNESNKRYTYKWTFGNGETSTSETGKTIFEKPGSYTASLEVKNKTTGCKTSIKKKVTIINGTDLFVENAFSPNGDNKNETFMPKALLDWDVRFEMTVIGKSGNLVYKTSDKNEPWNGKTNNTGQLLNEGIYLWQVIIYDVDGIPNHHHGKIKLIQ